MGKTIIKDDRLVEDFWLLDLAAEGADTAGESAAKNRVVSLEQWQQNRELLLASSGPRGVAISNDDVVAFDIMNKNSKITPTELYAELDSIYSKLNN